MQNVEKDLRSIVRTAVKNCLIRKGQLFHQKRLRPKIVVNRMKRTEFLKIFHYRTGRWDSIATQQFLDERFWWPSFGQNVFQFLRNWIGCHKSKPIPKYYTTLHLPITHLFQNVLDRFCGFATNRTKRSKVIVDLHWTFDGLACGTTYSKWQVSCSSVISVRRNNIHVWSAKCDHIW